MKIDWRRKTDAEFIEHIRYRVRLFLNWKWFVVGFMVLGVGIIALLFQMEIVQFARSSRRTLEDLRLNSYASGYLIGFLAGALFGAGVAYFALGLITIASEHRRDRLILDYHDRLQQAGLLAEAESKSGAEHPLPTGNP